jgi:hypothetical protein
MTITTLRIETLTIQIRHGGGFVTAQTETKPSGAHVLHLEWENLPAGSVWYLVGNVNDGETMTPVKGAPFRNSHKGTQPVPVYGVRIKAGPDGRGKMRDVALAGGESRKDCYGLYLHAVLQSAEGDLMSNGIDLMIDDSEDNKTAAMRRRNENEADFPDPRS